MGKLTKKTAIIIATEGLTTNLLYHTLDPIVNVEKVILETPIGKKSKIKSRIRNIGFFKTFGQLVFLSIISPIIRADSQKRIKNIIRNYGRSSNVIPKSKMGKIKSINSEELINLVKKFKPDFIFVNGTRIISKKTIEEVEIKMINIHVGITPKYRGVHGGYWALFKNDPELFGTTLHFIDSGIDSGQIIAQKTTSISKKDNFSTYPIIQYCLGLSLLESYIFDINTPQKEFKILTTESQLHFHPTVFQYIYGRVKGIK